MSAQFSIEDKYPAMKKRDSKAMDKEMEREGVELLHEKPCIDSMMGQLSPSLSESNTSHMEEDESSSESYQSTVKRR